jgi:predicted nucleic acid-binding protein
LEILAEGFIKFENLAEFMTKRFYLDTCIWRDYFEDRSDRFRPLGEWAFELIKKITENEDLFLISDHLVDELSKDYSLTELDRLFEVVPKKLVVKVYLNDKQTHEALRIKKKLKIPFGDALHAVIAKENDSILVSRDAHFYELQNYITFRKPEDLI